MLCLCISNLCARPRLLEFIRKSQFEEPLRKALHQPSGELQNLQHQYSAVALTYIDIGTAPPPTITPLVAAANNASTSSASLSSLPLSSLSITTLASSSDNNIFDVEGSVRMKIKLRWHNRYAVLNKNLLRYWKNEKSAKKNTFVDPRGRWVLQTVGWATTDSTSDVVITNTEGREAILRFASFSESQKWYKAISLYATQEDSATAAERVRAHESNGDNSKNDEGKRKSEQQQNDSSSDDDVDDVAVGDEVVEHKSKD
eukprot:c26337_g1_i1.p1 GENE.c26337_g1_i1~~c26337_g1_i1.p1  ORF type:complete len:258 (+),score=79.21 c26337_g1_i1:1-774(+)